ncbi:MAG: hypothetical protein U9N42_06645 [Campylobacterota bacterium]|nr:hypothetical protein [Campylobacterota bacterium]
MKVFNTSSLDVSIKAYNYITKEIQELTCNIEPLSDGTKIVTNIPMFDGFLLATINDYKVIRKIGYPINHFVIGYKRNYTLNYKLFDSNLVETKNGILEDITDAFYITKYGVDDKVINVLNTNFDLDRSSQFDFDVTLGDTTIEAIELPDIEMSATIGDIDLSNVSLNDIDLDINLADVEIKQL